MLADRARAGAGEPRQKSRQPGDHLDVPGGDRLLHPLRDDAGREPLLRADAVTGDEPGVAAVRTDEVDEGERAVGPCVGQHPEDGADRVGRAPVHRARQAAQLLQHTHPAGGEHPLGRLDHGVEQPRDLAVGLDDRAVGEGEVALLVEAAPGHREGQVLEADGPAGEDIVDHGLDVGPDVVPDVGDAPPQCRGVPQAQRQGVGVVVDHDQLRAPHEQHPEAGVQGGAGRGAQGGRPVVLGAQRCRGPVVGEHQLLHRRPGRRRDEPRQLRRPVRSPPRRPRRPGAARHRAGRPRRDGQSCHPVRTDRSLRPPPHDRRQRE